MSRASLPINSKFKNEALHKIFPQEKRDKQRQQLELENRGESEEAGSTKSSISINEPETQVELLAKLVALISIEKVPGMMAVRKGRVSLAFMQRLKLDFR